MADTKNEIMAIEEKMADAFNKGDMDGILQFFDQEIIGFSSTAHERLGGLEELKKTFDFYLDLSTKMEYSISSTIVQQYENVAITTFYWVVALISESNRREIHGRGSHVFTYTDGN